MSPFTAAAAMYPCPCGRWHGFGRACDQIWPEGAAATATTPQDADELRDWIRDGFRKVPVR